ncbi:zinc finger protein CONSTANS-LIKE 3-like [Cynara cardunculus var. scolymus]|uniref:CCT domain-containing protein n=1 Tax=Cynara cardunculus var. scolymus TaxID=59895 RepID=A0A103XPX3_CYNCS|nr:zinc finger protein CONSTANS-LIKE 3-like [Cynara cardunculus var. scolymus]KVH94589.1 CCT domain-containing protein [Cynara cardunculus var. scolymus]
MYGHSHNNDTFSFSPEFLAVQGSAAPLPPLHAAADYFMPPPPLAIPTYEFDTVYATSSGGYDSPSYTGSPSMVIQRSGSSHSIATQFHNNGLFNQLVSPPNEFVDSEGSSSTTMRRVFSAEDLQGVNMVQNHYHRSESPLSSESNSIIESMNKACRYSPDEKKERIERYRSKKTQRNFTKKIKYVCRKTLADSRPRIRGRFARNDEIEKATEHQTTSQGGGEEGIDEEEDDNWMNNFLDSFPPNLIP